MSFEEDAIKAVCKQADSIEGGITADVESVIRILQSEVHRLESECAVLVEALEFYADKNNWYGKQVRSYRKDVVTIDDSENKCGGDKARAALSKIRGEG